MAPAVRVGAATTRNVAAQTASPSSPTVVIASASVSPPCTGSGFHSESAIAPPPFDSSASRAVPAQRLLRPISARYCARFPASWMTSDT